MKINLLLVTLAIFLVGCNATKKNVPTKTETTVVPPAGVPDRDPFCGEPVGSTPKAILVAMDYDLDMVANGENPCGSFTDYFVPNALKALEVGASKVSVDIRIGRAVALAEEGKFLSSYEVSLVKRGGPEAVRKFVYEAIAQSKK